MSEPLTWAELEGCPAERPPLPEPMRPEPMSEAKDKPSRHEGRIDVLDAALELLPASASHREQFRNLCQILQQLRGEEPIALPLERIAHAWGCHWTLIGRLRRQGVVDGWLRQETPAIPHQRAATFRVACITIARQPNEEAMYHYKSTKSTEHIEGNTSTSNSTYSDTPALEAVSRYSDTPALQGESLPDAASDSYTEMTI